MRLSEHHKCLVNGTGKCSVPMYYGGGSECFCDKPTYGFRLPGKEFRNGWTGELHRFDGKFNGHVPGLACTSHGGPTLRQVAHQEDPCKFCGVAHDDVEVGPCPSRMRSWT